MNIFASAIKINKKKETMQDDGAMKDLNEWPFRKLKPTIISMSSIVI